MRLSCLSRRLFSIKTTSLVVISLQTTTMVLLLRYSRTIQNKSHDQLTSHERNDIFPRGSEEDKANEADGQHYVISTAVFLAEMLKLTFSLFFLYINNGCNKGSTISELQQEVVGNLPETCKMVVPAGLYILQNNLLFIALTNLDAATYQVTYQLRILCTAAFSWLLLGRRLTAMHWLALACLMVGVALVQVDAEGSSSHSLASAAATHDSIDRGNKALESNPVLLSPNDAINARIQKKQLADFERTFHESQQVEGPFLKPELPTKLGDINVNINNENNGIYDKSAIAALPLSIRVKLLEDMMEKVPNSEDLRKIKEASYKTGLRGQEKEELLHNTHSDKKSLINLSLEADSVGVVSGGSVNKEVAWLLGLLAVLVSCVLSAFSGVYFERIIKRSRQTSLLIRNVQLGLFSLVFGVVTVLSDRKLLWEDGFCQGYTWATWAVIAVQACGGLIVSVTMKYADNILKSFATSVSIVLSTLLSSTILGNSAPSFTFLIGTSIVLAASVLYGLAPIATTASTTATQSLIQIEKMQPPEHADQHNYHQQATNTVPPYSSFPFTSCSPPPSSPSYTDHRLKINATTSTKNISQTNNKANNLDIRTTANLPPNTVTSLETGNQDTLTAATGCPLALPVVESSRRQQHQQQSPDASSKVLPPIFIV